MDFGHGPSAVAISDKSLDRSYQGAAGLASPQGALIDHQTGNAEAGLDVPQL
jgi:hypothetical protein